MEGYERSKFKVFKMNFSILITSSLTIALLNKKIKSFNYGG